MSSKVEWPWPEDEALTLPEIAKLYGININTLRSWKRRGKLPEPDGEVKVRAWRIETIEKVMEEMGREKGEKYE